MFDSKAKRVAGLDIGQASAKLVILRQDRKGLKVDTTAVMDLASEGILDETELVQHLAEWVHGHGLRAEELVVNLPQFMVMAHVADFPPSEGRQLTDMVDYEVQQLAGLSDESFISGYRQYQPVGAFKNPVLIGVSREQMVRRRLELFEESGLRVTDLAMEGEALAAAYRRLQPHAAATDELHLVVDLGQENSSLVVLRGGQVLYLGSLMSGGHYFTEALARHLGSGEAEAERTKLESRLQGRDPGNPLTRVADNLCREIQTSLENWRQHSQATESAPRVSAIYLSGAGSLLHGLGDFLHDHFDCPVHWLRVPHDDDRSAVRLPIAYGLALQAAASERERPLISFAPADLTWRVKRAKRAPLLVLSLLLLGLLLAAQVLASWRISLKQRQDLVTEQQKLRQCSRLAPEVNTERDQINLMRNMMVPFAAVGNRNHQATEAVMVLSAVKANSDWFYLLADSASYNQATRFAPISQSSRPRGASRPFDGGPIPTTSSSTERVINVNEFRPWASLYASGFTPDRAEDKLATVQAMITQLNSMPDGTFTHVDVMTSNEISSFDLQLRLQWRDFMAMRAFSLRLPLREQPFVAEEFE